MLSQMAQWARRRQRPVGGRAALNSQLSTLNSSGTVLVLTVALLAMIALLATTFLVTARYDQVGVQGAMVSHQMEMLLSLLESDIRRKLTEDLWGDDWQFNGAADAAHEGYDGPDTAHPWLRGVCGRQIVWEPVSGGPAYLQPVVAGDSSWRSLAGTQADGLTFRYAVLIQDLGGLVNVNVARQPDPDMLGANYPVSPDVNHPENWPYTIWAFHALGGNPDWGYWWCTPTKRSANGSLWTLYGGMGTPFRGGGPAQQVDLRYLLADPGEVNRLDAYLRWSDGTRNNYGREFDMQDELDLRYPGTDEGGAPYLSRLQATAPSLFSTDTPNGVPPERRRLATAVARTTGWIRRREPIYMHPYEDSFWTQTGLDKSLCDERWFFIFDGPDNDDLIRYLAEGRMGFRISLQRGITLSRMWQDDPYNIYKRMNPFWQGGDAWRPISATADVPKGSSPTFYDQRLVEDVLRDEYPAPAGDYSYAQAPNLAVFLLSNTMAVMGVPSPEADPDQAASYAPQPYAHLPAAKSDRVEAYRLLAGALHLNIEDYQDRNNVPGMLRSHWTTLARLYNYRDPAGAENRPYLSEAAIEFELWPNYAAFGYDRQTDNTGPSYYQYMLHVRRVDKGTPADGRGLAEGDWVTGVRVPPATAWTPAVGFNHDSLRNQIKTLSRGGTFDLQVARKQSTGWVTLEITGIPVDVAVKTIAVEMYNPHDEDLLVSERGYTYHTAFRYCLGVPQQRDYTSGDRKILNYYPDPNDAEYASYCSTLPAHTATVFFERRGLAAGSARSWMSANGMGQVTQYFPTNAVNRWWQASSDPLSQFVAAAGNLVHLRGGDGQIVLYIAQGFGYSCTAWLSDAIRNRGTDPDGHVLGPPDMPVSGTSPGQPMGIADAFDAATSRIGPATPNPVVRLYRPLGMESRASQYMTVWDSWASPVGGHTPPSRLGVRGADEDDFAHMAGAHYEQVDARGFVQTVTNRAFRFGGDLSRVCRLVQPRLYDVEGFRSDAKGTTWLSYYGNAGDPRHWAPTEVVDREMRKMESRINSLAGDKTLASQRVRQILQKHEARLRFSPYTPDPSDPVEVAECKAMYDFIDAFTMGGAAYDNIDNNGNSYADEHGTMDFDLGIPPELQENNPGGGWLLEHSNCWPAYGRINVNTAPRDILENCLMAPNDTIRRELGTAIYQARSDDGQHGDADPDNAHYKPFTSLGDLYGRVSVLSGVNGGFDRFGFDGYDNASGRDAAGNVHSDKILPDMAPDPCHFIDDLDERNYLWRINSEIITLRSDTFAAYLRFQARREVGGQQKIVAERRVYEVWDRANCLWPPKRRDGRLHPDFVAPQRLGIQVFGY